MITGFEYLEGAEPDSKFLEQLDLLRRRGGHESFEEVLLHALTVYKWSLDSIESGLVVAKVNEQKGTYQELSVPAFARLKESGEIFWATWDTASE